MKKRSLPTLNYCADGSVVRETEIFINKLT